MCSSISEGATAAATVGSQISVSKALACVSTGSETSHSRTGSLGEVSSATAAIGSGSACSIAGSMEGSITDSTAGAYVGEGNAGGSGAISVTPFPRTRPITGQTDDSSKSTYAGLLVRPLTVAVFGSDGGAG